MKEDVLERGEERKITKTALLHIYDPHILTIVNSCLYEFR